LFSRRDAKAGSTSSTVTFGEKKRDETVSKPENAFKTRIGGGGNQVKAESRR